MCVCVSAAYWEFDAKPFEKAAFKDTIYTYIYIYVVKSNLYHNETSPVGGDRILFLCRRARLQNMSPSSVVRSFLLAELHWSQISTKRKVCNFLNFICLTDWGLGWTLVCILAQNEACLLIALKVQFVRQLIAESHSHLIEHSADGKSYNPKRRFFGKSWKWDTTIN